MSIPPPMFFIGTLSQTLTLRAVFASSTYLLSQIHGPGRSSDDDLLIPLTPFSRGQSGPSGFPSPQWLSLPASSGPASDDALSFGRCFFACIVLKKGYQCWTLGATHKSLIINTLSIFRVGIFATLKMVKQLSLSNLQVALHVSARQQGCPREDLPPSVLFFIGTLSQTMTLRAPLSIPPTPFSRGRSRPSGSPSPQWLSLPASSGPASDDALSLSFGRCFFACIVLKKGYQCWAHMMQRVSRCL